MRKNGQNKTKRNDNLSAVIRAECAPSMKIAFRECWLMAGFASEAEALRSIVRNYISCQGACQEKNGLQRAG